VESALSPLSPPNLPADYPYLTEGHHPPPATKGGAKVFAAPTKKPEPTSEDVTDLKDQADGSVASIFDFINEHADQAGCVAKISQQLKAATAAAKAAADAATNAAANPTRENLRKQYDTAWDAAKTAAKADDDATTIYNKCVTSIALDPPLSVISHQVQFIVAFSANATPSWALLHFKGPGPGAGSNSMMSAGQTNTHTLTITLGAPQSTNAKGLSTEANMQRSNQNINAAINNLGQKLTAPTP
jgi:hypothetical protein